MERSRRDLSINTVTDNFIFKNNQITLLLPSYLTQGLVFTFLRLAKKMDRGNVLFETRFVCAEYD